MTAEKRIPAQLHPDTRRYANEHCFWFVEILDLNLRAKYKLELAEAGELPEAKRLLDNKFILHFVYCLTEVNKGVKGIGKGKGKRKNKPKDKDKDKLIAFIKNLDQAILDRFLATENPDKFWDFKLFKKEKPSDDDLIYAANVRDFQEIIGRVKRELEPD